MPEEISVVGQAEVIPQDSDEPGEGFIKCVFGTELKAFTSWRIGDDPELHAMGDEVPWEPGTHIISFIAPRSTRTQPPERLEVKVLSGLLTIVVVNYTEVPDARPSETEVKV